MVKTREQLFTEAVEAISTMASWHPCKHALDLVDEDSDVVYCTKGCGFTITIDGMLDLEELFDGSQEEP